MKHDIEPTPFLLKKISLQGKKEKKVGTWKGDSALRIISLSRNQTQCVSCLKLYYMYNNVVYACEIHRRFFATRLKISQNLKNIFIKTFSLWNRIKYVIFIYCSNESIFRKSEFQLFHTHLIILCYFHSPRVESVYPRGVREVPGSNPINVNDLDRVTQAHFESWSHCFPARCAVWKEWTA